MTSELPKNAPDQAHDNAATVTSRLQGMRAGAGSLFARPLRLGTTVANLRVHPFFQGGPGPTVDDNTLEEWLNHARAVEAAHDVTIAWLRSRLPGYPMLRIPYLAPNTHLTAGSSPGTTNWRIADLAAGIQNLDVPPRIPQVLGATRAQATELDEAATRLAEALKASPEWEEFVAARQQLTHSDKAELSAAKAAIKTSLRDFTGEGLNMWESHEHQRQTAYEIIETLGPTSRRYCQAFDELNMLIELAASDVLGQLVAYGDPATMTSNKIDLPRAGEVYIDIGAHEEWNHHPGDLIRIDDPLLPDVMQVQTVQANINPPLNLRPSTLTLKTISGTLKRHGFDAAPV